MAEIRLRNSKYLGDFKKSYFVAEVNTSHFGDVNLAKKMIDEAKNVGCDCVKFQTWSAETLYSKTYYDENPIAKRFVKKFSFSIDNLELLSNYCKQIGIDFASTPYSKDEVDFLVDQENVPYIKVASMDLNNYAFLEHIAKKNKTIILSTGLSNLSEIDKAVSTIENTGNKKLILLHCTSIYPLKSKDVNLKRIETLKKLYPYPIGFSDHTPGFEIALARDLIVASTNAKFALPEPKVGLAALAGGMQRLPRQIGMKNALGMMLTGRHVSAEEGMRLGFVNEVVEPENLISAAKAWAKQIEECSPMSIRATKQVAYENFNEPDLEKSMKAHYSAVKALFGSEDFIEGPVAFAEKRLPNWKGK